MNHTAFFLISTLAVGGALSSACVTEHAPNGGESLLADAASGTEAGAVTAPLSANAGHTFTNLYDDYFGPKGAASCSGDGACHGSADQPGAQASNYYCPDKATCFTTLTSAASGLVQPGGDPKTSGLYLIIRKADGGRMPKRPETIVFQPADLQRITDWIAAGAPND